MKDGSFATHVRCGFTWFVLSSTKPPEVTGVATHVAIGNFDKQFKPSSNFILVLQEYIYS